MLDSFVISAAFMLLGVVCFVFFPVPLSGLFSKSEEVKNIARVAFPIIGSSFVPAVFSLMMPVFFQAIGYGKTSLLLSLTRQIFCLGPMFWLMSLIGLNFTWIAFPFAETTAGATGLILYFVTVKKWKTRGKTTENENASPSERPTDSPAEE